MGFFDWLFGRDDSQAKSTPPAKLPTAGVTASLPRSPRPPKRMAWRAHSYCVVHRFLPDMLRQQGMPIVGILGNHFGNGGTEWLRKVWDQIPQTDEYAELVKSGWQRAERSEAFSVLKEEDGLDLGPPLYDSEQIDIIVPSDGLECHWHWVGDEHFVILIHWPTPAPASGEAYLSAITTSPAIRYFTLEQCLKGGTMFCEWAGSTHHNYGPGPDPTTEGFLRAVCGKLGVPATIDPHTDCHLPERGPLLLKSPELGVVALNAPNRLAGEDAQLVQEWNVQANDAMTREDYQHAEQLYRKIHALWMEREGPRNTHATLAIYPIVDALLMQRRFGEAEELCRQWWRLCRRYRMAGHTETLNAITVLADVLCECGRAADARALLEYKVQLACVARGRESEFAASARGELEHLVNSMASAAQPIHQP